MATIQLGNTKIANKLISYAEKRAVERDGVDCVPEYAKSEFKATRELWNKTKGIQAHHVIQSFKPGEVTPKMANEIGLDLAKEIAKGYQAVVYTHADKDHIHNHIVINSVNPDNGKKYQLHGKEAIDRVRQASDELCREQGLSVVKELTSKVRYTLAEKGILERGKTSWKDELRQVIDHEMNHSKNFSEFKENLTEKYGIEVKERGKSISFKHPDSKKFVRGKTLGLDYERGTLENGFSGEVEKGARTIRNILLRGYGERISVNNSPTNDTGKSNQQELGETREKREGKNGLNNQIERDTKGYEARNNRPQRNKPTRDTKDISSYARGNQENRGQSQGNDKANKGHGVPSKRDSKPQLEGKGETIRGAAPNNNRLNGGPSRGVSTGEPVSEVLKSLSYGIRKASNTEQQQKEKQSSKKKDRSKDWEMDR